MKIYVIVIFLLCIVLMSVNANLEKIVPFLGITIVLFSWCQVISLIIDKTPLGGKSILAGLFYFVGVMSVVHAILLISAFFEKQDANLEEYKMAIHSTEIYREKS